MGYPVTVASILMHVGQRGQNNIMQFSNSFKFEFNSDSRWYYKADKSFLKGQDRAGSGSSFVLKKIHRIFHISFPKIVRWFLKNTYDIFFGLDVTRQT